MQTDPWAEFRAPAAAPPAGSAGVPQPLIPRPGPAPPQPAAPNPGTGFILNPDGTSATVITGGAGDPTRPGGERDPNRDPGVDQARMSGFLRRAARANNLYIRQNVGAPTLVQENMRGSAPNLTNAALTPEMRQAQAAQQEFIAATLRYESGAAIPPEELEAQRRRYFPMPFDDPATIALKAELRRTALQGLAVSAGPGADAAMAQGEAEDVGAAIARARMGAAGSQQRNGDDPAAPAPPGFSDVQFGETPEEERDRVAAEAAARGEVRLGERPDPNNPGRTITEYGAPPERQGGTGFDRIVNTAMTAAIPGLAVANAVGLPDALAPVQRGAFDIPTMGLNQEIRGGLRTLGGGTLSQNISHENAIDRNDEINHPWARLAGQVAGGFALPGGGVRSLGGMTGVGAAYGGAYGFGSTNGSILDRVMGAGAGAAVGGATALGVGGLARGVGAYASRRAANVDPRALALAEGMNRQGIEGVSADLNPARRGAYSFLESMPISGGRVRSDLERGAGQLEGGIDRFADNAPPRLRAGDIIQAAGDRFDTHSRDVTNRLYTRAQGLAGGARIEPRQALSTLDRNVAELSETPSANGAKLAVMNQLRADLVDDAGNVRHLSIQGLRDLRTAMRDELSSRGMRFSDAERRVMQVIDAAGADIEGSLSGNALTAYQRADRAYRQRVNMMDNIVERFIGSNRDGRRSGEQAMTTLENMAAPRSGDSQRLDLAMRGLTRDERRQVGGAIISQMGRRGQEEGADFSPARFFTDMQRYSPESREAIFGRQGARDLDDLARFAEARGGTIARMNNSGSGRVSNWFNSLGALLSGSGGGAMLGYATGFGATTGGAAIPALVGGAYVTARVLGNRDVARNLVAATRATTPAMQRSVIRRLGDVAARNPAISQDVLGLQRALMNAANDNIGGATRAAAEDEANNHHQRR